MKPAPGGAIKDHKSVCNKTRVQMIYGIESMLSEQFQNKDGLHN